jgi:mannosyl-oligosaccharide alpha-1,2-mannosidase
MPPSAKRLIFLCSVAAIFILGLYQFTDTWSGYTRPAKPSDEKPASAVDKGYRFAWKDVPIQHPVASMIPLPMGQPVKIPKIQYEFMWSKETKDDKIERERRADTIRKAFARTWTGYTTHAWLKDELLPISGQGRNVFGGWATTLVDSLDTLHIMGFKKNFNQAINALAKVDFSRSTEDEINVFETAIRYLGGFLSAYDLSGNSLLLDKAVQVGEMLYVAFDTPNRMPIPRWHWRA